MLDSLFDDSGEKALRLCKIFVAFELVVTLIIGFILCINSAKTYRSFSMGKFLAALLILAVVLFFEYVSGLLMVALCQMMADVAAIKNKLCTSSSNTVLSSIAQEKYEEDIIKNGGWKCASCGRIHPAYETSCICGVTKDSNILR